MKQIINKKYFLGLFLLSLFLTVWIVSVTNWQTSIITTPWESEHIIRLHSLFLWGSSVDDTVSMKVNTWEDFLTIQGWLAIWSNHNVADSAAFSAIGWWKSNTISGLGNWIVWWEGNSVDGKYSLIGWWKSNRIESAENSVIGWWSGNIISATDNSVIAWWAENSVNGQNSVILWGRKNKADWGNSLVMWQESEWNTWSFAWSAKVINPNSARINAKSGVLIWTYTPITWVKLVVSWAVSLTWTFDIDIDWWTGWEIRVVNWCIYAFDGNNWQVMWKSSRNNGTCAEEMQSCRFWETLLYQWDTVDAYENFWSESCRSIKVECSGWDLLYNGNTWTYYPYCYKIFN